METDLLNTRKRKCFSLVDVSVEDYMETNIADVSAAKRPPKIYGCFELECTGVKEPSYIPCFAPSNTFLFPEFGLLE